MAKHVCRHIARGAHPAITSLRHTTIPGADTHVDELDETTELCIRCSGLVIALLKRIEEDVVPASIT